MIEHKAFFVRRAVNGIAASALATLCLSPAPLFAQSEPSAPAPTAPTVVAKTGTANINITPRRVVFDRTKRADAVYVFNQGNASITVDVALIDNVMLPNGEIVPMARVPEKGPDAVTIAAAVKSAKPLLIVAPSRLMLAPGQGKTIRLRALTPEGGEGNEYRTHLTVTTVPPPDTGLTAEQAAATQRGELVLRIQSIFGLSIPVILRSGPADASASFGTIRTGLEAGKDVLEVPIRRSGKTSVYGNIEVRSGKSEVVGLIRGLAVYPEISERMARVPLNRPLKKGEVLRVTYVSDDAKAGTVMAAGSFTAP